MRIQLDTSVATPTTRAPARAAGLAGRGDLPEGPDTVVGDHGYRLSGAELYRAQFERQSPRIVTAG